MAHCAGAQAWTICYSRAPGVLREKRVQALAGRTANKGLALDAETVIADYRIAFRSRQASLIGRKEVLGGKAKFGIFGDGKELPQLAMAHAFRSGDFRSGYYRDQTFAFATGMCTLEQFFAQLYADTDLSREPMSGGRQMNGHFASRSLNDDGTWRALTQIPNNSADVSPTGSQMPRLVGLAYASKLYREVEALKGAREFSRNGDEVAFGTIGNASTAEGMFWEAVNAAGVLQVPMLLSIWDDGYGISVPNELQVTKGDVSAVLSGFQRVKGDTRGMDLHVVRGWDYAALCRTYLQAAAVVRAEHVPAIIHVVQLTQPQGHSTSGSHERYKSRERLLWEEQHDGLRKMREWMMAERMVTVRDFQRMDDEDTALVRDAQRRAYEAYRKPIDHELHAAVAILRRVAAQSASGKQLEQLADGLERLHAPFRRDVMRAVADALVAAHGERLAGKDELRAFKRATDAACKERYGAHLYSESTEAALKVPEVKAQWTAESPLVNGFEIINRCFDQALARDGRVFIFGEDVGRLGDVNQGCAGLQDKYGPLRVGDTGIRECTILGQGIGMAMRGLRPVVEIQYLDYLLYALQIMSDDLATVRWRTRGGQKAPVIVRTRGHRLEGVWHSGSPMSGILGLARGIHICVPRNMTQAAGMYNTLLRGDDPGLVIEVLNAYRLKEALPSNLGEFTVPLGVPEVIRLGQDVTLVTYGACCKVALDAAEMLARAGVQLEVIDVQTLLPFDVCHATLESVKKTGRIVFLDEDVPGGATAYMMHHVLQTQGGYSWLDSPPVAITAQEHRPAYGSDGDYWSKPNREMVFDAVYALMSEADPNKYPSMLG
jgi:pyruvate/2-oxoglutarate/acetoin dehydrogenase E1 component/TPP-dependent pyruvate/acetoin dehydrogenase alpha subunit